MKSLSLQDQLLKAGLTSKTKAHKVNTDKRKQTQRKQKNKVQVVDRAAVLAEEAKARQLEKDRLLNEKRNRKAEKRQIAAQIAQLVKANKLAKDDEAPVFHFTYNNEIKSIYVPENVRKSLIAEKAVIVMFAGHYEVVPAEIAQKIAERDSKRVIYLQPDEADKVDDGYADYAVPDDLMW
ncbi:MAG: DUF2058 domain-containing protein [Cycloclasticus sp.]|nr:nucleoprotein/polynucleotide-associated enzyme [Cycloclasticus sp. 46_83_sub15_T18]OUR81303.1 nucleoprotein/polynucleotide-associated enzyme [Cycloclasticus sp. 46_120_T64]